eukprot:6202707-Pleurochrysis_carterae.AAC.1
MMRRATEAVEQRGAVDRARRATPARAQQARRLPAAQHGGVVLQNAKGWCICGTQASLHPAALFGVIILLTNQLLQSDVIRNACTGKPSRLARGMKKSVSEESSLDAASVEPTELPVRTMHVPSNTLLDAEGATPSSSCLNLCEWLRPDPSPPALAFAWFVTNVVLSLLATDLEVVSPRVRPFKHSLHTMLIEGDAVRAQT